MLKKEHRLSSNFEFNITRKYGEYIACKYCHVYILEPKNYEGDTKVGIVISNKFDKRAVIRNRMKRVYREAVQRTLPSIKSGLWIVIHPKFGALTKDYEEICTDLNKALQKVLIPR
jgi:ribonuclease P protein component